MQKCPFANVSDLSVMTPISAAQRDIAEQLLIWASDRLRYEALKVNKCLDEMAENEVYASVLRSVVVGIVQRAIQSAGNDMTALMSQFSQSAGGYTVSGSVASPGEALYIKRSELKALGLSGRRFKAVEIYGECN